MQAKWQPGKEDLAAAEQQALEAEQHEAEMVVKVRAAMLAQSGESALPAKLEVSNPSFACFFLFPSQPFARTRSLSKGWQRWSQRSR